MTTITLDHIGRTYPAAVPVRALHDVTLTINQGDYVAIEGPSGAGKSTLLNIIALLDTPTEGRLLIDDTDASDLSDATAARLRSATLSFIFQSFHLLPARTAEENVLLGAAYQGVSTQEARSRARQALEFVGLSERMDIPAGQLSGGERQRVAIARAICAHNPILVADEPTGNLDSRSSAHIMDLLEALNQQGTTIIIVTHDPSVAARARRRLHVVDGRVTESAAAPALGSHPSSDHVSSASAASSTTRPRLLMHDIAQSLVTDLGRSTRLAAVIATAVLLFCTVVSLSYTARFQVSEIFDAALNRRVAVGLLAGDESGPDLARLAGEDEDPGMARVARINGVDEVMSLSEHGPVVAGSAPDGHGSEVPLFGIRAAGQLGDLLTVSPSGAPDLRPGSPVCTDAVRSRCILPVTARTLDAMQTAGEVYVGQGAASAMGLGPLDSSPTIWINGVPYGVAGLITDAGLRTELVSGIVAAQPEASAIQPASGLGLEIRTRPGAAQKVASVAALTWQPEYVESSTTTAPPDPTTMRDQLEGDVRAALVTLTVVAAVAGIVVLSNAMEHSVRMRTGELALRRAIGARRMHLRALIAGEATVLGGIGGVVGAVVSIFAVLGITIAQSWRPVIDPFTLPLGVVVGTVTGLVAATLAARHASRIDPATALR